MGNNQQLTDQLLNHLVIRFLNRKCHNHLQSRKSLIQCWPLARNNQHQEDALPFSKHPIGVGDGHRLHDVLQFFEASLKHRIVKK